MSVALHAPAPAIVARTHPGEEASYLRLAPTGQFDWVDRPAAATAFSSMREATRMAMRLPSSFRAFGLPRAPELAYETIQ